MILTNDDIIEVLEKMKVFNAYKRIAVETTDKKYLRSIEKKQALIISEIKSKIFSETYFLFHQLYSSIERGDYER